MDRTYCDPEKMLIEERIRRITSRLERKKLPCLLLANPSNVRYASGFTGDESLCLISPEGLYLITDFRYVEQARRDCPVFETIEAKEGLYRAARDLLKKLRIRRVAAEYKFISHKNYLELTGHSSVKVVDSGRLIEKLRQIKHPWEISAIRAALSVSQKALRATLRTLTLGMTEKAIADALDSTMKKLGADAAAFETIAATGPNSSLPHARPTSAKLKPNSILLLDWGSRLDFYTSDLTRTFFVSRIPPDFRNIYLTVLDAQKLAIESIKPGMRLSGIDGAARDYITSRGYGKNFGHGLGHGVGLDVHEGPVINPGSNERAMPGMIFTIEPAVYIPGRGGIRIEDMVLVTESGCEVLSNLSRGIRSLPAD